MEAPKEEDDLNSLESPVTADSGGAPSDDNSSKKDKESKKSLFKGGLQGLATHINIYMLLFIFIVVVAIIVVFIGVQRSKKESTTPTISTQPLSQEELEKLSNSDAKVGDPKQTLSVESNAIFAGKVLIRDSLDVAGALRLGGPLAVPSLNVTGTGTFNELQLNKLSISGDASIQGQLTIQKTLNVTGGASFGGPISAPQISIGSLQLNGDLTFNRHIDAGGGTPGKTDGGALGGGGTSSVSGTDTAGTVNINTGGGPGPGCFVTLFFTQSFNSTPHVVITPVGSGAAGINYYVTRTNTSFSICTTNSAPGGTNFAFDYIVID
mgnify:CR=1 FL=1